MFIQIENCLVDLTAVAIVWIDGSDLKIRLKGTDSGSFTIRCASGKALEYQRLIKTKVMMV